MQIAPKIRAWCGRQGPIACVIAAAVIGLASTGFAALAVLFLIDDTKHPTVTVSWPTTTGKATSYTFEREYADPARKLPLGDGANLSCYVAVGGTRLDVGLADPKGGIVRVGFYKIDPRQPLFANIAPGAPVTIKLNGVHFRHAATVKPLSGFMHAKFDDPGSVLGCNESAGNAARDNMLDLYNTADPQEDLGNRISARNGRKGILSPEHAKEAGHGSIVLNVETDGSITMTATIPYPLFKHPDDPWLRSNPGDFAEPFHFHIEFEALPAK